MGGPRWVYGRSTGGSWEVHRKIGGPWEVYERSTGGPRRVHGRSTGDPREVHGTWSGFLDTAALSQSRLTLFLTARFFPFLKVLKNNRDM